MYLALDSEAFLTNGKIRYDRSITDLYWNTDYVHAISQDAGRSMMGMKSPFQAVQENNTEHSLSALAD